MEKDALLAVGNAAAEGAAEGRNGWFLGHFVDAAEQLRHTGLVELKWGVHGAGESKSGLGVNSTATTLSLLISGRFVLSFPELGRVAELTAVGDYALWSPGVLHEWRALSDCVVMTVRWPSLPRDQTVITGRPQGG